MKFFVPFGAKREENFEDICAPQVQKNENLETMYSQLSGKYEKPRNPSCKIWISIFQNLKNLNLEVAGGDLKGGVRFNTVVYVKILK